jgi:hypothetical protein
VNDIKGDLQFDSLPRALKFFKIKFIISLTLVIGIALTSKLEIAIKPILAHLKQKRK